MKTAFKWSGFDWYLLATVALLVAISLATLYSLTLPRETANLVTSQVSYIGLGMVALIGLSLLDYRRLRSYSWLLYLGGILLLVAVLIGGKTVFGATRWIELPGFQLQPSELLKLFLVMVLARVLAARAADFRWRDLFLVLIVVGLVVGLVVMQPDLGTAGILILSALALLIASSLPKVYWLTLGTLILIGLPLIWLNLKDYQLERIQTFLDPSSDPYGSGYNVLQSLIAVGNGGLFGQGFGQGTQSQLEFLPVAHTDFIFAGIAEATGLVGSILVVVLLSFLVVRAFWIARRAPDTFGALLAIGIGSLWLVQFGINIGMNLGMAPVTGIPLPFLSHGGSALVTNFAALGILESIARKSKPIRFRTAH